MGAKYEIYLDESGKFEQQGDGQTRDVCLIGGLVVPEELKAREAGLRAELMELGKPFFPDMTAVTHIHASDPHLTPEQKQELKKLLLRFLWEKMPEASLVFIYTRQELETKTPAGPQFYRCMLLDLIKSIVFYHPGFADDDAFQVNLAHRRAVGYIAAMRDDLLAQGYKKLKDRKGKVEVTAITTADVVTIMRLLKDSLSFTCTRQDSYRIKPYAEWDNPFMTMADFICNTLYKLINENHAPARLDQALATTFRNPLRFYAHTDYDFPSALLSHLYRGASDRFIADYLALTRNREARDKCSDRFLLVPAITRLTAETVGVAAEPEVYASIIDLADQLLIKKEFDKLDFVLWLIRLVAVRMDQIFAAPADGVWDPIAYRYHDVCLRYCNHTSDIVSGLRHWRRAGAIYNRLPGGVKEFGQKRALDELYNRISVFYSNAFAFERAIDLLSGVKGREETITKLFAPARNEILGKVYGSLSQNYAFQQQHAQAVNFMDLAEEHLGPHPMQRSFRAHLSVERRDKAAYQSYLAERFKLSSFSGYGGLIPTVLKDPNRFAFDLHLLIKGLLIFPTEPEDMDEAKKLLLASAETIWAGDGHPWQLIWTLFGRLLVQWGQAKMAHNFWMKAADFAKSKDQHTFYMMGHAARAWQALALLERNDEAKARPLLYSIRETFIELGKTNRVIGSYNPNGVADDDKKVRAGWFDAVGRKFEKMPDAAVKKDMEELCREFVARFTFNYW